MKEKVTTKIYINKNPAATFKDGFVDKKMFFRYLIRERECKQVIEKFATLEEAEAALEQYEKEDKEGRVFSANYYEIVEL
ncbi:MAG: hypothetical protein GY750_15400 [Lentisphaerae bacterium]|nr:hypothetical protein [Lentisphaerota bacterium]MCP4102784.1 hypothetical protein [Lentisphaerota bacterium]